MNLDVLNRKLLISAKIKHLFVLLKSPEYDLTVRLLQHIVFVVL